MKAHRIVREKKYIGRRFRNNQAIGPFPKGTLFYCFAEEENYFWLALPHEWFGVTQLKIKKEASQFEPYD